MTEEEITKPFDTASELGNVIGDLRSPEALSCAIRFMIHAYEQRTSHEIVSITIKRDDERKIGTELTVIV